MARPTDKGGVELLDSGDKLCFIRARDGDHLVTPFQCDLCHFCNIMGRDPIHNSPQDVRLQKLIRRANFGRPLVQGAQHGLNNVDDGQAGSQYSSLFGFQTQSLQTYGTLPSGSCIRDGARYSHATIFTSTGPKQYPCAVWDR
jgi:hypothetical protein